MTLMAKLTQKKIKKKKLQIDLPEESALNREKEKRGILASPARKGRRKGGHQRGKGRKVKRERRKKAHQRRNMMKERKGIQVALVLVTLKTKGRGEGRGKRETTKIEGRRERKIKPGERKKKREAQKSQDVHAVRRRKRKGERNLNKIRHRTLLRTKKKTFLEAYFFFCCSHLKFYKWRMFKFRTRGIISLKKVYNFSHAFMPQIRQN